MATSNAYDIAKQLMNYMKADTTFTNFCTSALGTVPAFYVGLDLAQLPTAAKLPFVALVPVSEQDVDGQYLEHQINLGAAITKDNTTIATAANTLTFDGYNTALRLSRQMLASIKRCTAAEEDKAVSVSTTISLSSYSPARITHAHPEFHTTRELTITTQI
jgi:hypothetical protein